MPTQQRPVQQMTMRVYAMAWDEAEATNAVEEGKTTIINYKSNILLFLDFTHSMITSHSVVISELDRATTGCLFDYIFDRLIIVYDTSFRSMKFR